MIELRQRSSTRNSGYQRLSLDEDELDVDDEEYVPLLNQPAPVTESVESSSCKCNSNYIKNSSCLDHLQYLYISLLLVIYSLCV